jgi:hypothetical protein
MSTYLALNVRRIATGIARRTKCGQERHRPAERHRGGRGRPPAVSRNGRIATIVRHTRPSRPAAPDRASLNAG